MPRKKAKFNENDPPGRRVSDEAMARLFDEYEGRLISPGGVAQLLGVSRQRVHQLIEEGKLTCFRSEEVREKWGILTAYKGAKWAYVPTEEVYELADKIGRPIPRNRKWGS